MLKRRPLVARFKSLFGVEETAETLKAGYMAATERRYATFRETQEISANIRAMAEGLCSERPKLGFYLCGKYGNGKTTLAHGFQEALPVLKQSADAYIKIMDADDIAQLAQHDYPTFRQLCIEPMLIIEDMGKEPREVQDFGNVHHPMAELLERRYDHQLFTIVTTNVDSSEVKTLYGQRVADRLREMFTIIPFGGSSFRADFLSA